MTEETYRALKGYRKQLELADRADYVRMTRTDILTMNPLFKDAIGRELTRSQAGCSHCVVRAFKDTYKAFLVYAKTEWGKQIDAEDEQDDNA